MPQISASEDARKQHRRAHFRPLSSLLQLSSEAATVTERKGGQMMLKRRDSELMAMKRKLEDDG